jgi:hypothetical protein
LFKSCFFPVLRGFAVWPHKRHRDITRVEQGPDTRNCCSELLSWNFTFLQFLSSLVVLWSSGASPGGSRRCQAASKEVPRGQGKARPPERWRESSGRGLDDDFLIEAFSCQVWSFSVLLGRLQVVPGGCRAASWEVSEAQGKPRVAGVWPESYKKPGR